MLEMCFKKNSLASCYTLYSYIKWGREGKCFEVFQDIGGNHTRYYISVPYVTSTPLLCSSILAQLTSQVIDNSIACSEATVKPHSCQSRKSTYYSWYVMA